jgi:hypothetical protein
VWVQFQPAQRGLKPAPTNSASLLQQAFDVRLQRFPSSPESTYIPLIIASELPVHRSKRADAFQQLIAGCSDSMSRRSFMSRS